MRSSKFATSVAALILGLSVLSIAGTSIAQPLPEILDEDCVYGDCENGRGTLEIGTPAGKAVYRGSFRDGEFHGFGRLEEPLSFTEKAIYEGNWADGKRSGRGKYYDGKGDLYIGEWLDDMRHGKGSYFVRIGRWNENQHTEFWLSQNTENYTGDFVNDLYQGQGIYRWKNGSRYEGGFFANDRHGFGTFYYSTGTARKQLWEYGDFVR
ncbi:MAG: hypothetical protein KJN90_09470 [Gammaproteobacteria bacterium]|nr:hypothetical protein [Gammaproteobacteria bacterium]